MRIHSSHVFLAALAATWASAAPAADKSEKQLIANAISAAPKSVGKNAAVMNWDMKTLKKGTNGFTCFPNDPGTPSDDPMCVDENGMAWMQAYMKKQAPPEGKVGFAYMLKGDSAASNTDPFATKPPEGADWLHDGPHVMIMNSPALMAMYPHEPDPTQPYVMFPDTPYAHLMIPVK
ncbi:hypothetical protein [Mesorhizobium dulcispinae]|uniref:hypothetical protein n=1 Tax=Mesorhizobium dulcispinae TaxID=3072316 RepID=UPI002A2474ED|nr:hypothetical protein [Mesorhizobium sp. VK23D]MDX8517347.1 hypothetical protein [Mesorhizobium sp. VK23D]